MSAQIIHFPIPSVEQQKDYRENCIVQHLMEMYQDRPYPLVTAALDAARKALDADMSLADVLYEADQAANAVVLKFTRST